MFFPTTLLVLIASLVSSLPFATAVPVESSELEKRIDHSGQATWFEVGLGACGDWDTDEDYIVALNSPQYGWGDNCQQYLQITNNENGYTAVAKVRDECPSCAYGSLDMSPSLFEALASGGLDEGVFPITWHFYAKSWEPSK